jgi:GT2 family glycosyltransferase
VPDARPQDLTVVIPTRDRWAILQQTLEALSRQTVSGFQVVVAVDGEDQEPPALPSARVIVCPKRGPGAARNAAVRETARPLVLFLGDDVVPSPGLVEAHIATHAGHPGPSTAVLGRIKWHPASRGGRLHRWMDWSRTQFDYVSLADLDGQDVGFGRFYSSNVSLKTEFFLRVGGFDEDFTYYYEDLDLGWRLSQLGLSLIYTPAALGHHLHSYDWESLRRRFAGIAAGERLMAAKHEWFEPFFRRRVEAALAEPPTSILWTHLVDLIPPSVSKLRRVAEDRANRHYHRRLAPAFLHAWNAGDPGQSEAAPGAARTAP